MSKIDSEYDYVIDGEIHMLGNKTIANKMQNIVDNVILSRKKDLEDIIERNKQITVKHYPLVLPVIERSALTGISAISLDLLVETIHKASNNICVKPTLISLLEEDGFRVEKERVWWLK